MIAKVESPFSFPHYIDGDPLFQQLRDAMYNARSPLLQANSRFISNASIYPAPFVHPQSVRGAIEIFDTGKYLNVQA